MISLSSSYRAAFAAPLTKVAGPSSRLASASSSRRGLRTSTIVRLADQTVKDPNHPTGIYFHPLKEQGRYAITLLPKPPSSPDSASIMGFIGDHDGEGQIYEVARRKPDLVQVNKDFLSLLHKAMKSEAVPNDGMIEYEAHLRNEGFAHVSDPRHQMMPGRIPTPENIIASVAFTDGKIRIDSYEANETYRIITHEEGFIQLKPFWQDAVLKNVEQAN